jgi:hypothetical protein
MLSDLEHGVRVLLISFASLTEIEIGAHTAFVSDSNNGSGAASVASHSLMHLSYLISLDLTNVVEQ